MFEKVNPSHPDKVADRIAGALVDYAYTYEDNPKIAVEVLIGHGTCLIISETSISIPIDVINGIVDRIAGIEHTKIFYNEVPQDEHLAANQEGKIKCGDNGIFKGVPVTGEEENLTNIVMELYKKHPSDGKYLIDKHKLVACQSNVGIEFSQELKEEIEKRRVYIDQMIVNPLGEWTGGINVDSGATNRKLGSDMGFAVTGGGLHGKDLSKADVSINIYAFLKAQETGKIVHLSCAIGDEYVDGKPYSEIVQIARNYITMVGGFEKFAEWGLCTPPFN